MQAGATGSLTVTATLAASGDSVRLELRDAGGTTVLATGTAVLGADGQVSGQSLTFPGHSGQTYLVRVLPGPDAAADAPSRYTLDVRSLTADLGTQVYGERSGSLAVGDEAFYALSVAAPGSLEVTLTPAANAQGHFRLELIDPINRATLASGQTQGSAQHASLAVTGGQAVYLQVVGDVGAQGDFTLTFINLDQFATPNNTALFFPTGTGPSEAALADVNRDGKLDVIVSHVGTDTVSVLLNNGDGTFQSVQQVSVGQTPVAVAVADFGSVRDDGSLGPPDGHPDLIVVDNGLPQTSENGPAEIVLLPGLVNDQGHFAGFGSPIHLASAKGPLDVKVGDVNGGGATDIVAVDSDGVEVIYGKPPVIPANNTPQTARNLGTVVHVVEPAQTIVPGHIDAYYTLKVPTEAARGPGDEIIDFFGLFQASSGAGLSMEVRDAADHLLGVGERFRVRAPQGARLTLHIFGVTEAGGATGFGAFTLDIDVLPQVVSVEAQPLLPGKAQNPGGPTASLVLTFQGDRLDPAFAQDPANYRVTWLGPDGLFGTADDRVIAVRAETTGGQPAVYDPGANIDVASGKTYPTAVRQTVTLLFADPLPAGSYAIELSSSLRTASFNEDEAGLLSASAGLTGHPLVTVVSGAVTEGDRRTVTGLVTAGGAVGDPSVWKAGTPFLSQLHDDLAALLDARLTKLGDSQTISAMIDRKIVDRFDPALGTRPFAVLVIWLDPVIVDLDGGSRGRASFDPHSANSYQNTFSQAFVSVTGSVELLVLAFVPTGVENYVLNVEPTPTARGGLAYFGPEGNEARSLTAALREGTSQFLLSFGDPTVVSGPTTRGPAATPRDSAPDALRATEALFALNSNRSDTAGVRPTTPYPSPTQADLSTTAAGAARGETFKQIAGSGGTAADPTGSREIFMERVLRLIAELGRKFPSLARSFGNILRSLGVRFAVQVPGPALQPPAADKPVPTEGVEAEVKLSPPADGEAAQAQPEAFPSQAQALLIVVVGLTAGYFVRRNNSRDPASDGRKNQLGAKPVRPRRPDHVD